MRTLNFFRLIDENGLLSLTNIAVIVVIAKLSMAQQLDFSAVAALLTAIGGYSFKRFVNKDKPTQAKLDEKRIQEIEEKVGQMQLVLGFKK